jgi:hypothetical protein
VISGGVELPGAGIVALSGAAGYLGGAAISGNFSISGLGTSTAIGAVVGAVDQYSLVVQNATRAAAAGYLAPRLAGVGGVAVELANRN